MKVRTNAVIAINMVCSDPSVVETIWAKHSGFSSELFSCVVCNYGRSTDTTITERGG